MVSGRDGSTASGQGRRPGSGSAVSSPLPVLPPGSGVNRPASVNSETVIHAGGLVGGGLSLPSPVSGESPSSQVVVRLFPPTRELGSSAPEFDPSGLELGHFRIEERIGMGGMGAVFRALDLRLQRNVALKLLAPSQSYDPASVKRFENEARAAARLDHENIARVYFIGEERGLNFIAFEYVTGSNVRDLIRRSGNLSPTDTVNYALQIAYALKHTSAMGVVHRDVKPSNIIITPQGRAKLVDLGLARKDHSETADLTVTGTTLGTFDYISPEQAKDPRSVDVRSDIYSLGCTMYHMLTGQPPYPEGTALQKLLDHQNKETPNPQLLNSAVSDDLASVVLKMMNSDRNKRYQTPDLLIRDLSLVANQLGLRGLHPEGLVWLTSRALRPKSWVSQVGWIATVALLLGVVGLLQRYPQISRRLAGTNATIAALEPRNEVRPPNSELPAATDAKPETETSTVPATTPKTEVAKADQTPQEVQPPKPSTKPELGSPAVELATRGAAAEPKPGDRTVANTGVKVPAEVPSTSSTKATTVPTKTSTTPDVLNDTTTVVAVYTASGALLREYRTLEAACSAVEDGGVIELRFNGSRTEKPCRIAKKNVTIRGARGFDPIIRFAPTATISAPTESRMVQVQNGRLSIVNVQFELAVPIDGTAPEYALFGLTQPSHLQLTDSLVTVTNPRDLNAAVLSLGPDRSRSAMDMPRMPLMASGEEAAAVVELSETLVRGNCVLTSVDCQGPIQITLRDSLLALGRDAITITSLSSITPDKPNGDLRVELKLDHVTSTTRGHFLRFLGAGQGDQRVTVRTTAHNSIFVSAARAALIQMETAVTPEDARRVLRWSGERNFYAAAETMWTIASTGEKLGFEEWVDHWGPANEVGPNNAAVLWLSEMPTQFSSATATNFVLRDEAGDENPAVRGATDGGNAGADLAKLPQLPVTEARALDSAN